MLNAKTVLILAPHTDDGEIGCGATIARLIESGARVHYVAFSICEKSVPAGLPSDILATEVRAATAILGLKPRDVTTYRFPVRDLPQHRQDILERLIVLRNQLRPDLVFLPSTDDIHQDHQTIAQEGIRAFKHTTLVGYEFPWNMLKFSGTAFVALQEQHIQAKVQAMQAYKSQTHRSYVSESTIKSLAHVRGQQAGTTYAEAFEVIRWIVP